MFRVMIGIIALISVSCSAPVTYSWQDSRVPARDDFSNDLKSCKEFAARQYQPGVPAGEPYLKEQKGEANRLGEYKSGEWRPDRDPWKETNIQSLPRHDVPVDYTGYPGELDYYPNYLDDILEKCMSDKGWEYLPTPEDSEAVGKQTE